MAGDAFEEFRVTKIHLDGPDGQSISKPMTVPAALKWLREKTDYDEVEVRVEMDLKHIEIQVAQIVLKAVDKALKAVDKALKAATTEGLKEFREKVKDLVEKADEAEEVLRQVDRDLPGIRAVANTLKWSADADRREEEAERRLCDRLEALRKEMLVPGRTCGSCGERLYDKGIAVSPGVGGYLCAPCGAQQCGERLIVPPERKNIPYVYSPLLPEERAAQRFIA